MTIAGWDRHGLERLVRYCARPPLSQERLGRLDDETLVYSLRKPTVDGRSELILTPLELLDRLAHLVTPPTTGSTGAAADGGEPGSPVGRVAARCWALLLARIFECLTLACPECGEPMRIIAFVLDRPAIERILTHIGEPPTAPTVSPARAPPQTARELDFDQVAGSVDWPDMDQTAGTGGDTWE